MLPWEPATTGQAALTQCLAHGFVHIGEIKGIRALAGFPCPPEI